MARTLPRWMHEKHGAYYLVRGNKWRFLSRDLSAALAEYAKILKRVDGTELGKLIDRALSDLALTVAPSTLKNYKVCAGRVIEAFAEFSPEQIKPHHVARFLDDNKATPSMANLLHAFLRNVFVRAVRWGVVETNPVRDILQFKTRKRDRYITADEFNRIRENATPTLQCLMDIAYISGQRMGDVMKIKYSDITDAGVLVRQQKTGSRLLISMTSDLEAAVNRARQTHQSVKGLMLLHKRNGTPLAYGTIHHQWLKACEAAGVENARFHDIRAAAATDAKAAGQDSKTLLGHTTESSHNRYLRSKETPVATPNRARNS